jgi:predicted DNA-binding transcriptional regulator YafY
MTLQMTWDIVADTQEEILREAIEAERPLCFRYTKKDDNDWDNRSVSPYEIRENTDGDLYLLSWDHEREDVRSFLLDGIEAITTCPWFEYRPAVES